MPLAYGDHMRRHDENDDGHLSHDEFPERLRSGFDALDRNDDGKVSHAELQAHAERMASHRHTPVSVTCIWVMDTDQGRASLQELQQAYGVLQGVDQDEDGNITRNELRQRQREMALQWVDHCFQNLDDNDDGEISNSEAKRSAFAQRFERLDGKDDDVLTRRELQAAAMPASRESPEGQTETNQNSGRSQAQSREPAPIHTGTGRPLIDEYPGRSMGRQQGSEGVHSPSLPISARTAPQLRSAV